MTVCIGAGPKIFAHKAVLASHSTCFQKKARKNPLSHIDLGIKGSHAAMKAFLKDFYMTDTYSESECSVVFQQVLHRVRSLRESRDYPQSYFARALQCGTVFNGRFAARFASEVFSSLVMEVQRT
ncbi:hypothetical protein D6D17_10685 [Aureobasidium pullulans]|nr:hypothetical protein D6D17_10685 [Aureobasidium pullulans]